MGDLNRLFISILDREGNTFIQSLLDAGLDVNALILNNNGRTMLSCAAACGNLEIVEFLLQRGADGNVTNSDGSKPLHAAAANGRADIVKLFLKLGVFVDSRDHSNSTPLHYVARNSPEGDREVVHILVNNHADLDAFNKIRHTPLLTAARFCSWGIVEQFINLGANVECCDRDEWTVLHYSCHNGWSGIVRSLLEGRFDIDLNVSDCAGNTPLIIAAKFLHKDVVKLLIKSGADVKCRNYARKTVLHHACKAGWLDVVKSIINKGCDLDGEDFEGNTPLMMASDRSHEDVVKLLVKSGANIKCKNFKNKTLLHSVCAAGWLDFVKYLISKGCDVNAKNSYGDTPVSLACVRLHSSVVGYLIESGADFVCVGRNHRRPVAHFACRGGWSDVVKSLIQKGIDVNAINCNSDTFLHLAVRSRNLETIELLLKAGADCNVKNCHGKTAFNYFVKNLLTVNGMILFIEYGAYFQYDDYVAISEKPFFKQGILQNIKLCTQAVINKFNNVDLPRIYKMPGVSESLPSIERLKIATNTKVAWHIAQSVEYEIATKGYCNVWNVQPIALSILSTQFLHKHYDSCH